MNNMCEVSCVPDHVDVIDGIIHLLLLTHIQSQHPT